MPLLWWCWWWQRWQGKPSWWQLLAGRSLLPSWSLRCWTVSGGRSGPSASAHSSSWNIEIAFREAAKKKNRFFLGNLSQMWVGGVADSQTRSKPLKTPPNHPENRPFWPEFHLSYSQISQKPWGGWVGKQIWDDFPKKNGFIFGGLPLFII